MGDGLEYRNKDETAHTQPEDGSALRLREHRHFRHLQVLLLIESPFQRETQYQRRNNHRHQRRYEYLGQHTLSGNHTLDPEHDGGDITYRRKGSTRVGGNNDKSGIDEAFLPVLNKFAQHHNHHYRSGKIIENGRQEKRHKSHTPQKLTLRTGLHRVANKVETSVAIHNLYDGHGTHQEKQRFAGIAKMMLNAGRYIPHSVGHFGEECGNSHHKHRPAPNTHQQGNGRLVDFQHTLQGYTQITYYEEDNNKCR